MLWVAPVLLAAVLARPKFKAYVMPVEVDAYVEMLRREAILESDPPSEPGLTPNPGDDYLVSLARAAEADVLVSGDPHLIGLRSASPPVLTPRQFLERI